jgi:cell division protein FtsB
MLTKFSIHFESAVKNFFFWQIYLQKQAMLVRQLEEELRLRMRAPNIEMQQQIEALYAENEHLTREIAILRDTIKVDRNLLKSN